MTVSLEQILGFENLTKVAATLQGGVPNVFGPEWMSVGVENISGNVAEWFEMPNARTVAPTVNYGSPSRRGTQENISRRQAQCIHSYWHIDHKMATLEALRAVSDPARQERGRQIIDFQTAEAVRKQDNLRISALTGLFANGGNLYFDGAGDLLPTSSGAYTTVPFNIPANNRDQLNGIIGASWATDTTPILEDLLAIQNTAVQVSGLPLTRAYYGTNIPGYMLNNNDMQEVLKANPIASAALMQGKIPDNTGFDGLKWRPLHTAFFRDANGTDQSWFGGDVIVFTPEPTADWFGWLIGSFSVPDNAISLNGTAANVASSARSIQGLGTYAMGMNDPPGLRQYFVDTFLPVVKVPSAVFVADTTP